RTCWRAAAWPPPRNSPRVSASTSARKSSGAGASLYWKNASTNTSACWPAPERRAAAVKSPKERFLINRRAYMDYSRMFDLTGKNAAVNGATTGNGKEAALLLATYGANVNAADLTHELTARTAHRIKANSGSEELAAVDFTDTEQV